MKRCSKCNQEKTFEEFPKRSANRDGYAGTCKLCKRAYDNAHYRANPYRKNYIRSNSNKRLELVRKWLLEYLNLHPCVDCGEADVVVLEFDHRSDKVADIARLMRNGSLDTIKAEVSKCDVRCCNCHRRKTAKDFGSWRIAGMV